MDLKELKPKRNTIEITLVHPMTNEVVCNDDGSPMTITVYTPYSKEYKEVMYERADERIRETKDLAEVEFSSKLMDQSSLEILARTTASWNITYDGRKPRLTIEKAKEIYTDLFWVRPQIDKAINEDEVFT